MRDGNAVNKIIFVSDYFVHQAMGGAELHDDIVLQHFANQNILHDKVNASELTSEYINQNLDKFWFISNFAQLKKKCIDLLSQKGKYVLYEHDYKFTLFRNPIHFKDFVCPKKSLINLDFYKNAIKVICLSKMHKNIFEKNLSLDNLVNINCSMWSDDSLNFMKSLANIEKKKKVFAVIKSPNPIKKTKETIKFCEKEDITFELIASTNYHQFLTYLAKYEGLVFMTGHPEPTPRIAIEAKILNCKFISQKKFIGVAHEDYWNLNGVELADEVQKLRDEALEKILNWIYGGRAHEN